MGKKFKSLGRNIAIQNFQGGHCISLYSFIICGSHRNISVIDIQTAITKDC